MPEIPIFPAPAAAHSGYPTHKRPTFASVVQTASSGREVTGSQQVYPIWEFELPYEVLRDQGQNSMALGPVRGFTELQNVMGLFLQQNGPYAAFAYADPADGSRTRQPIGVGDGLKTAFVMGRTFSLGTYLFQEPVGLVDVRQGATLSVFLDGVTLAQPHNWWIDTDLRTLRFAVPPAAGVVVTATFSFFYFCHFIDDQLDAEEFATGRWSLRGLKFRSTTPNAPTSAPNGSGISAVSFPAYTLKNQNTALTGYVGPGDLQGFTAWGGLRAYSQAAARTGHRAIQVKRSSDGATRDIHVLPNGDLDRAACTAFITGTSATLTVTAVYDQTDHGWDLVSAAGPPLIISDASGLPAMGSSGGLAWTVLETAGSFTPASGIVTLSLFFRRDGATSLTSSLAQEGNNSNRIFTVTTGALVQIGPAGASAAAPVGAWHAVNCAINGLSSAVMVDGANSTGSATGSASAGKISAFFGAASVGLRYREFGALDDAALGNAARTAIDANQRAYWGT